MYSGFAPRPRPPMALLLSPGNYKVAVKKDEGLGPKEYVDEVLTVPMLSPRSYTREDVVELQCHGSEVCLRRVLRACLEAGATLVQPDAALAGIQGGFSSLVRSLRSQCIELLTGIEVRLGFDDEMPPLDLNLVTDKIHNMSRDVENALEIANYDRLLQSGL